MILIFYQKNSMCERERESFFIALHIFFYITNNLSLYEPKKPDVAIII